MDAAATSAAGVPEIVVAWQALAPQDAAAIQQFWLERGALRDATAAQQRLPQVVAFARSGGAPVAVCTAYHAVHPQFGQAFYHLRMFVEPAARRGRLVVRLLRAAIRVLEAHARQREFPCIGVLLELENRSFRRILRAPVWKLVPFVFAGVDRRGIELRVLYFRGARLRPPPRPPGAGPVVGPVASPAAGD